MSAASAPSARPAVACRECRRRSWLLGELSAVLDYHRGDPARLLALMKLADGELIEALGGRRRDRLAQAWGGFGAGLAPGPQVPGTLCRHSRDWPARFRRGAPAMLWMTASAERLGRLLSPPTVAVLGARDPSPYGAATAGALARGLAAAGVTVLGPLTGALAAATHRSVIEASGCPLAVAGDGLSAIRPAPAGVLARELTREGCVVSELPPRSAGRGWGAQAAQRIVIALSDLVVLVEARSGSSELSVAQLAPSLGRPLAAVPGPASSSLSDGPHELIRGGARLVRDAQDVLELLYEATGDRPPPYVESGGPKLAAHLRTMLERVGAGEDTAECLLRGASDPGAVIAALGELEVAGALQRMSGGRYVVRERAARGSPRPL